jgi:hypothetical protein
MPKIVLYIPIIKIRSIVSLYPQGKDFDLLPTEIMYGFVKTFLNPFAILTQKLHLPSCYDFNILLHFG